MLRICLGIALAGSASSIAAQERTAAAADAALSADYHACMAHGDAASGVTSAMLDCIAAETARQDARLNRAYKAAMAARDPAGRTRLRQSERAWIARRDARCQKASASEGGGSAAGLVYADCVMQETVARAGWLEAPGR
ncbi:DUF1311 domain-containing protein [Sphingomonas naasensis]|uniref:DUF1311 domain-containing protein n=2 Tax=Sphingomonas naasensis TaxID=1344951 RepID=A0A4S1WD21_9SPHN|nr:DUF1311 domain-containing protein [Sphingomonas naasensis]